MNPTERRNFSVRITLLIELLLAVATNGCTCRPTIPPSRTRAEICGDPQLLGDGALDCEPHGTPVGLSAQPNVQVARSSGATTRMLELLDRLLWERRPSTSSPGRAHGLLDLAYRVDWGTRSDPIARARAINAIRNRCNVVRSDDCAMVLRLLRLCVEWGVQQDNELQSTARSLALRAAATCADDSLVMIGVASAMLKLKTMRDDALAIVVREGLKPDDSASQSMVFVLYSLGEGLSEVGCRLDPEVARRVVSSPRSPRIVPLLILSLSDKYTRFAAMQSLLSGEHSAFTSSCYGMLVRFAAAASIDDFREALVRVHREGRLGAEAREYLRGPGVSDRQIEEFIESLSSGTATLSPTGQFVEK